MQNMTSEEIRGFLAAAPRTGKLATVREDGWPHVTPIWFHLDGEEIVFTTWHTSIKAANIRRDPRVSLCVDDEKPPYAYVIVAGHARFIDDPQLLALWATRIAGRYMGPELAESYGKRNSVPGELLVRMAPLKIIAHKGISD
jgi:PPOX class probable F420-dependent enzyme